MESLFSNLLRVSGHSFKGPFIGCKNFDFNIILDIKY